MKPILEVKNISKKFNIGKESGPGYLSLRESIMNLFKFSKPSVPTEEFWALKNISFDVYQGESIGIIGKNGAGKSTFLKVLSKITPPTEGRIISRGRIASLLEVGTGFHPELTGKENIFLNGSILGMKRNEIQKKFDEIIDFSGVEKFLNTPLKHYSSGMQLRLAFSVAAFLEPEILVIDEVLAVGDAEFQKKCLGKMGEVCKSGRTILFVSHNMSAIEMLCEKSILLSKGQLVALGESKKITNQYLNLNLQEAEGFNGKLEFKNENNTRKVMKKIITYCDDKVSDYMYMGCNMRVDVHFQSETPLDFPVLGLIFKDMQNIPLFSVNNKNYVGNLISKPVSEGVFSFQIPYLPFINGIYSVDVHFGNAYKDLHVVKDCFTITVEPMVFTNNGVLPDDKYNRFFIKDVIWKIS